MDIDFIGSFHSFFNPMSFLFGSSGESALKAAFAADLASATRLISALTPYKQTSDQFDDTQPLNDLGLLKAADDQLVECALRGRVFRRSPNLEQFARSTLQPAQQLLHKYEENVDNKTIAQLIRQQLLDMGRQHWDSVPFKSLTPVHMAAILSGFTLRQIVGWGNEYANGVSFVYGPAHISLGEDDDVDEQKIPGFITLDYGHGLHHEPERSSFILRENESIQSVSLHIGEWADSLRFTTSEGREFRVGESDGGQVVTMNAPPDTALISLNGLYGGHIHAIGCVWASTTRFHQPKPAEEEAAPSSSSSASASAAAASSSS